MAAGGQAREASGWLERASLGAILGLLRGCDAQTGLRLLHTQRLAQLIWNGQSLEGITVDPICRVLVEEVAGRIEARCSLCGNPSTPCAHAAATLLKWPELRTSMLRMGVGTIWRAQGRQKFLTPNKGSPPHVELGDQLSVAERLEELRHQLALQGRGGAVLRAAGERLELLVTTSSGVTRTVGMPASLLPEILLTQSALPPFSREGELARLRASSELLQPVLRADTPADGTVVLQPMALAPGGRELPLDVTAVEASGGWLRVDDTFFRLAPLPPDAVGLFRRGRQTLTGTAAVRFLASDHVAAVGRGWYRPSGSLAARTLPQRAAPVGLEVEAGEARHLRVRLQLASGERPLPRAQVERLMRHGFLAREGRVLLAPDLTPFEEAGFRPRRGVLEGDSWALLRATADLRMPVRTDTRALSLLVDTALHPAPEAALPAGLTSRLRAYQREGYAWLRRLWEAGLGGVLADEMGLGKTHQAMALLCAVHEHDGEDRALVVCPRGVLEHWHHLLERFAPGLPVALFHGADRRLARGHRGVVLTTYDVALRSVVELAAVPWSLAIFDEAQRIKNAATKGARAVKAIPARMRVALTGTPIENNLPELWSIMDLVVPGYLGSQRAFAAAFRAPSTAQLERLQRRLAPFLLRRVKAQVLNDLPPKSEEVVYCPLASSQRRLYQELHAAGAGELARVLPDRRREVPYMHIFALLTRLKQACDHPALVEPGWSGEEPGKYEVLDEILDEVLEAGRQVVVFSQYVAMIELLSQHLARRPVPHLVITGKTPHRAQVVERFNSGRGEPVLLASLLASGVGIDLTAASVVVHYDRWWNPAREDQASDRVHRIGQRHAVRIVKLVTVDTIEERIEALLESKRSLARDVVAPTAEVLQRLTREELAALLGIPLAFDASAEARPHPAGDAATPRRGRRPCI